MFHRNVSGTRHDVRGNSASPPVLFYLFGAALWVFLLHTLTKQVAAQPFWLLLSALLVLSLPILMSGLYSSTIRQTWHLTRFNAQGWLYRVFSGRLLRTVFWFCWSPLLALFLLLQFYLWGSLQWLLFLLLIPLFWLNHRLLGRLFGPELKPWLLSHYSLLWACRLTPLLMLLIQALLAGLLLTPDHHPSLAAAIAEVRPRFVTLNGSALLRELAGPLSLYAGMRAYAASLAGSTDYWMAVAISALGSYLVYFSACSSLSALLIPAREYRRLITPLTEADPAPTVRPMQLGLTAAFSLFIIAFIYVPGMAYLEAWAQQSQLSRISRNVEAQVLRLDRIGSNYYQQGTLADLEQARLQALQEVQGSLAALEGEIDQAFDQLISNVDTYLDWYYSLAGEYGRLGSLMVGELETYMQNRLTAHLQQDDHFQAVQTTIQGILANHEQVQRRYQQTALAIMQDRQVDISPTQQISVVNAVALDAIMNPPLPAELITLEQRALGSTGGAAAAGVMSALIVQKITVKVAGKNLFKLAASAMAKLVLGKTTGSLAGAGAGAVSGAALGSVVPGAGTALGAVVGGLVGGVLAGISIDKALIELEEYVNREAFRADIVSAIEEARQEFKASLGQTTERHPD